MGPHRPFKSGLDGIVWPAGADRRGGDDRRPGRRPAGERAAAAGRDRGGAGRAARPPGRASRPPFAGVSRPARGRGPRRRRARQRRAAARAAAAVAPAAPGRGQGLLRRAGAARARAGRRGHDLRLDRRAGEDEEDRHRPAVLGRLHDSRPSLARPRFRRPHDLDPADQSALRRDGGLGLPGRRAVRDRQGAGDAGHDGHRRAGRRHRPVPAAAPALLPEQPEGARRSLGGAARGPAGEHPPRAHRRRDALGRPARAPRAHARPADRGQLLLAGGRHHRPAVPRGRALSHDGRVAGGRGARRARAGPAPRARSAGWS